MFPWHGVIGIFFIILAELNFFFKIEPFATHYFIIIWLGYILFIDALVYQRRNESLLKNKPKTLAGMFFLSTIFWWVFELLNGRVSNWSYTGSSTYLLGNFWWKSVYFSTVLPALFETHALMKSLPLFARWKLRFRLVATRKLLFIFIGVGVVTFLLPLFFPKYFFPLVWVAFFFLLDPINYLGKRTSILKSLEEKKLALLFSLLLSGIILGFLWEFWNYWAVNKWYYNIPVVGFWKVFEMPLLGYLGYFPFALELYAMYWFVIGMVKRIGSKW